MHQFVVDDGEPGPELQEPVVKNSIGQYGEGQELFDTLVIECPDLANGMRDLDSGGEPHSIKEGCQCHEHKPSEDCGVEFGQQRRSPIDFLVVECNLTRAYENNDHYD